MNWLILILIVTLTLNAYPTAAQNNGSTSIQVINQSANGLDHPSSSYIGPGTLSKTAQAGAGYIPQPNPGLPKVNRGAYIGTPGDNLYSDHPDLAQPPQPIKVMRAKRVIYKQATVKNTAHTYVPDPNIPMSYSDFPTDSSIQSESTKPAISGDNINIESKTTSTENK